jgi:hypothetical protein
MVFPFPCGTSQSTVCRSIGEYFWKTFNVIGQQMMTIPMSILCVRESAAMRLRDPVMQGGGV